MREQEPLPSAADDAAAVMASFKQKQEQIKHDKPANQ